MKESIAERVGRIISANLNMLVRSFANDPPHVVMDRAITEIDSIIEDVRAELGKVSVDKYHTKKRLSECEKAHQSLGRKIEELIAQKLFEPAEALVSQQLDIEIQIPVLQSALKEYDENEKLIEGCVKALLAKKREMMREWQRMKEVMDRSGESSISGALTNDGVATEILKVETAFERMFQKKTGEASSEKLSELDNWVRKTEIKDRIAWVKKKMEGES